MEDGGGFVFSAKGAGGGTLEARWCTRARRSCSVSRGGEGRRGRVEEGVESFVELGRVLDAESVERTEGRWRTEDSWRRIGRAEEFEAANWTRSGASCTCVAGVNRRESGTPARWLAPPSSERDAGRTFDYSFNRPSLPAPETPLWHPVLPEPTQALHQRSPSLRLQHPRERPASEPIFAVPERERGEERVVLQGGRVGRRSGEGGYSGR